MDDDIDDLFIDHVASIQTPQAIPGLPERIDELRLTGCCQFVTLAHARHELHQLTHTGKLRGPSLAVWHTSRRMARASPSPILCYRPDSETWEQNIHHDQYQAGEYCQVVPRSSAGSCVVESRWYGTSCDRCKWEACHSLRLSGHQSTIRRESVAR